jgi:hypothetical protein
MYENQAAQAAMVAAKQYAACAGGIAQAQAQSEIDRQLNDARNALDRLMGRTESLRSALAPVLKPVCEGAAGAGQCAPVSTLSPLADSVRTIGDGIDSVVQQLEAMLNRLAV